MISDQRNYSFGHWFLLLLIIIPGIILRFYDLDVRALHHDESLHGYYSYLFFKDPDVHFYKYNPLLHGPLLYHTLPFFYWIFDVSKFVMRMPVAIISSVLLFTPIFFRDKLKFSTILIITSLLAFSPSILYWSRFIRHDFFVILGLVIILIGYFIQPPFWKAPLIGLGSAIHFCTKENFFVHFALLIGFIIFEHGFKYFFKPTHESILEKTIDYIIKNIPAFLIGIAIFSLISTYFYTYGFQYWDGIIDATYRKSIVYWFNQHQTERIGGPFSYLFILLTIYDSWLLVFLFVHLILFYRSQNWLVNTGFLMTFLLSFIAYFMFEKQMFLYPFLKDILKVKTHLDFWIYFPLIYHSVAVTAHFLKNEQYSLAVSGYLFFATFFTYSYLGEKVPWLGLYPLIIGVFFFSLHFTKELSFHWGIFFIPILCFNIYKAYLINFKSPGDQKFAITQVQTSNDFENKAIELKKISDQSPEGLKPRILAIGSNVWPLAYYFRDMKDFVYNQSNRNFNSFDFIFMDQINLKEVDDIERFEKTRISMRHWWVPDQRKITWKGYFKTLFTLEPWNKPGTKWSYLLKRKPQIPTEPITTE